MDRHKVKETRHFGQGFYCLDLSQTTAERAAAKIISEEFCPLFAKTTGQMKRTRPFHINRDKCKNHQICIGKLGCPAMSLKDDMVTINRLQCTGCAVCAQICPENAILPVKE